MKFLVSVILHRIAWNKQSSLESIREGVNGVVNVKLAQFLSNFTYLIGEDVAEEFRKLTHDAPIHSITYSKRVVKEDLEGNYDLRGSTVVGSGSIAQIHKLADQDIVLKIVHPHAEEEIQEAIESYAMFKDSRFLSSKLKIVCDVFFDGLQEQLDMRNEYENGRKFISGDLYVCPEMIEASRRCLVMRYEPSIHMSAVDIPKEVLYEAYSAINRYSGICLRGGCIHADMHEGNFGVRFDGDSFESLVIYDFGFVHDLSEFIALETRIELAEAGDTYNFVRHKNAMLQFMGVDEYSTDGLDLTRRIEPFSKNVERFVLYYFTMCEINPISFKLFSSMEKFYPYVKAVIDLEREMTRSKTPIASHAD